MKSFKRLPLVLSAICIMLLLAVSPLAAQEPVTLTFMFWGDPNAPAFWQPMADAFIAEHPNVTINFIHQPDEYETKLQTLIAAGTGPDVFLMNNTMLLRYADEGVIADQQPYYDAAGVNIDETFIDAAVYRRNGELIAIGPTMHSIILYYNKAMFDAAGVAYPPVTIDEAWTWDQFVETAHSLTSGEGMDKVYGVYLPPWPTIWTPFVFSNGGAWFNDDVTELTLNTPEAVEALTNMANMRLTENVAPTLDVSDSIGWDVMLQSGKAAMFIDGTWSMATMIDSWGSDLGIAVLPKYDEYRTATYADPPVIWSESPNKDLAFEFVRFISDPARQIENFRTGGGVPTQRSYLTGDNLQSWLEGSSLPEHYDTVAVENLNYSGVMPGTVTPLMPSIEWPVVMNQILPAFRGEIDMQAAMDTAHDEAAPILAGGA